MKKLVGVTAAIAMTMTMVAPSFAAPVGSTQTAQRSNTAVESTWVHNGVTIHVVTDHKVTGEDVKAFEGNVDQKMKVKSNLTQPDVFQNDPSGTTVAGPDYKTYDNSVTTTIIKSGVYAVQGYSSYLMTKLGGAAGAVAAGAANAFWNPIQNWLSGHMYSYNALTVTKAYSNYYGYYQYFDTLTTYKDSSFTTVDNCYYYDTGVTE